MTGDGRFVLTEVEALGVKNAHAFCRTRWPLIYRPTPKIGTAPEVAPLNLAERVGFEPTVRLNRTPDFESGPFDHSGTSPVVFHSVSRRLLAARAR